MNQRPHSGKNARFPWNINSENLNRCEICERSRSTGNHDKCSKERQRLHRERTGQ